MGHPSFGGYKLTGERVGHPAGTSGTRVFWYDVSGRVQETDGGSTNEFLYVGDERMARISKFYTPYYFVMDHLNTARMSFDQTGTVCYDADYFPWGDEQHVYTNTCSQNYKFTGKERDPDMGVYDFGARFFQDAMARFYQPDWSATVEPVPYAKLDNPQTLNLYAYVANNPMSFRDPSGHIEEGGDGGSGGGDSGQGIFAVFLMLDPQQKQQNQPEHDANHTVPLVVRDVSGQTGNPAGHVTVQVGGGKEVGFGPAQPMTKKQIAENASVPGVVEPRATGTRTLDAVTIYLTPDEAKHAQSNIDVRSADPGNYQPVGRSCVDFGEAIVHSTGANAPSDTLPASLIQDIRSMQVQAGSNQAP